MKRLAREEVAGHYEKCGRFERIATTHGVERVTHVVGAGTNNNTGIEERANSRKSTWRCYRIVAALQEQVGLGERDDVNAGFGDR